MSWFYIHEIEAFIHIRLDIKATGEYIEEEVRGIAYELAGLFE